MCNWCPLRLFIIFRSPSPSEPLSLALCAFVRIYCRFIQIMALVALLDSPYQVYHLISRVSSNRRGNGVFLSYFLFPLSYSTYLFVLLGFTFLPWCYVTLGHLAWDVLLALLNPFFSSLCQTYYIYVEKGISSLNEYVHERKHPSTILHTSWTTPVLGSPIDQCILPEPYKHIPLSIRALPGHFSASTRRRRKVYLFSALTCLSYFLFDIVCDPSYPAAIWLQTEYGLSTLFGNTEAIDDYWLAAYLILPDWWSLNSVIYFSS